MKMLFCLLKCSFLIAGIICSICRKSVTLYKVYKMKRVFHLLIIFKYYNIIYIIIYIINKYNLNNVLKYEFFKANHTIQGLICHNLFLIQLKSKSKNNTINILNKIEYKLVNKNKWLTYFLEKNMKLII